MKRVFVCENSLEGIYSGIYDAWEYRNHLEGVGLAVYGCYEPELFCAYYPVDTDRKKAESVGRMMQKNLDDRSYLELYRALLSADAQRGDAVLQVLLKARTFSKGRSIMNHLSDVHVAQVFELSRQVSNEVHFYIEIIRFFELKNGILFSKIEPKAEILADVADHFSNRFSLENFMILDVKHETAIVHEAKKQWVLVQMEKNWREQLWTEQSSDEEEIQSLWKCFFESISIKERENPKCQNQHLPMRYRAYMTEFQKF